MNGDVALVTEHDRIGFKRFPIKAHLAHGVFIRFFRSNSRLVVVRSAVNRDRPRRWQHLTRQAMKRAGFTLTMLVRAIHMSAHLFLPLVKV